MARDKLITIRIEGEKRDAFNQLAKAQNTDTASLLYDFISGCLDGRIDISLVTGKKQWIDKIDNQIDNDRIDKLETTTQRIDRIDIAIQRLDNRIDGIETTTQRLAKRLDDWIEAIDDRLTDCDQGLSEKEEVINSDLDIEEEIEMVSKPIPKTQSAIAKELGLKSQSTLTYWVKKGEIPALYRDRVSLDGKRVVWIKD